MKLHSLLLFTLITILLAGQHLIARQQDDGSIYFAETRDYRIADILSEIKKQYVVSYENRIIPFENSLFLRAGAYNLTSLLVKICRPNKLKFDIDRGKIYITPRRSMQSKLNDKQYFTLKGIIKDQSNGEVVIGASIVLKENDGVISNGYGFYSITLPKGNHLLTVSHTGYETITEKIDLTANQTVNIRLTEKINELAEVIIQGRQPKENVTGIIPGINTMNFKNKGDIPYFLGEVDVLQGSLLLPGINNLGEDSNGINIRGGSTSQNLVLLDEAVIFNTSHLYGLISIFNPESVNDVEIFKGSIPARYGGRSTSVISIRQRDGNDRELQVAGGLGLVAGRLTIEGPIIKEKSSFLISGRRSLVNLSGLTTLDPDRASFVDLNFKVNYKMNPRNKFYLSGYFGDDRSENRLDLFRKWGNRTASFRWNHLFSDRLFSNTSIIFSEYTCRVTDLREAGSFQGTSKILNYDAKFDFSYYAKSDRTYNFGGGLNALVSNPGDRLPLPESGATIPIQLDTELALLPYLYFEQEGNFSKFKYNIGARVTSFFNIGPEDVLIYGSENRTINNVTDTVSYKTGEVSKRYFGFEPRAFLSYRINTNTSVKTSYARNYQFLHLISNTLTPSPTDIWKLSDRYIKPVISDLVSLGYYKNLRNNEIETSAEIYYRRSKNVIEYRDNADLPLNENVETEILFGRGRAYGLELFMKKNSGNLTGWISYTLSKSETVVDNELEELRINSGEFFPNNFDQTHQFSATMIYHLSDRLSFSSNFVFATGKPTTLPAAKYELGGIVVPHFTERNKDRLPTYHRMDVSLKLEGKKNKVKRNGKLKKKEDYWTFSIYNLYGRRNVFSYLFVQDTVSPQITEIVPFSVLSTAIPSVTYNFKF
ncbi:MAG: TonB-dependent receptor [Cyclobacteriaceae bacterium]